MSKATVYTVLLGGIIAGITLTVIFAPTAAPIAVPVYASVAVGVMALLQGASAAAEVKEVKETAKVTADVALETREVTKSTHVLVNSSMMVQLELTAELSRWKAEREPTEINLEASKRATQLLEEHRRLQDRSDSMIARSGFGAMPSQSEAEISLSETGSPVDVQSISPEAAKAIADAVTLPPKEET